MTKKIFEELPARKHAPAKAAPAAAAKGEGNVEGEGSDKKIRQAVYDIRYRARREGIDLRAAYSQYMSNSNLTAPEQAAVRAKLFGKDGGGEKKESYDMAMTDGATSAVAKAMFKVFVEKNLEEEVIQEDETSEKKYKVRVIDEKSGRSYVRYADREKITALRAKGLKVEMTEHGDPYEGERKKKGGMDPVAKNPKDRDGDVNNDGKKDGTDKYIYNRRDAINAAIAKKKGEVKEDFLIDGTTSTEGQNKGKITGTNVDNSKLITVNPENTADAHGMNKRRGIYAHTETEITASRKRLFEMIAEKKKADACSHNGKGEECGVHGMKACPDTVEEEVKNCGCGKNPCVTYGESKEDKKEDDTRANKTYRDLLKNKMRSAGMNVFAACGDEDKLEDSAMKAMTAAFVRPGEDGKMKMVSLYDKGDSGKMKKEDYERSPEANAARQEAAKNEAQKAREEKKKRSGKKTPFTAGGGVPSQDGQVDRYRDAARRRAQQRDMENSRGK